MKEQNKLEDLNVMSNFLFNAIATDPDISEPFFREMLSILLERDIGEVTIRAQRFLTGASPDKRGIQLDVEITEKNDSPAQCTVYSVEAQGYRDDFLYKRSRFYQARKDSRSLKRGEKNWNKLPDLYMIFITNYDPFGQDSMIYTFRNICLEHPDLEYDDGLKFIYFNTKGHKNGTKSIKQLLNYLNNSKIESVTNEKIAQLHNYVSILKYETEVKHHYMTVGEWLEYEIELRKESMEREVHEKVMRELRESVLLEGRKSGLIEGRESGLIEGRQNALIDLLTDFGTIPDTFLAKLQEADATVLSRWTKLAARADSMENFLKQIG